MKFTNMQASIFNLEDARVRAGLPATCKPAEKLRRGRSDTEDWIISTTMFDTELPGDIPLRGHVFEFGIPKHLLQGIVGRWERKRQPIEVTGHYLVNGVASFGKLRIDFGTEVAELLFEEDRDRQKKWPQDKVAA